MSQPLILIVGLQKSGTSLLRRILTTLPDVQHPFRGEGNDFWGNQPPFTPTGEPAGVIYHRYAGKRGHAADAGDATREVKALLQHRMSQFLLSDKPIVNKNPFNSVRIPWLRALFPDAIIVATFRDPLPHVYSLSKKYVDHDQRGRGPESGWWG